MASSIFQRSWRGSARGSARRVFATAPLAALLLLAPLFYLPATNGQASRAAPFPSMIDDTTCDLEQVDEANSHQLNLVLKSLMDTLFFRLVRVDMRGKCQYDFVRERFLEEGEQALVPSRLFPTAQGGKAGPPGTSGGGGKLFGANSPANTGEEDFQCSGPPGYSGATKLSHLLQNDDRNLGQEAKKPSACSVEPEATVDGAGLNSPSPTTGATANDDDDLDDSDDDDDLDSDEETEGAEEPVPENGRMKKAARPPARPLNYEMSSSERAAAAYYDTKCDDEQSPEYWLDMCKEVAPPTPTG